MTYKQSFEKRPPTECKHSTARLQFQTSVTHSVTHGYNLHVCFVLFHRLEKEAKDPLSGAENAALHAAEIIDFKKMFAETKAHSKAIDMELRKCEVAQANRHISLMSSYMSASFLSRGGDHEAVLALLLVPRILWKVSILTGQIKEKFVGSDSVQIDKNSLLKGHTVERFAFGGQMVFYLNCLMTTLHQYNYALSTCSPEVFLKIGTLFPEMSAHEKSVDFYIELLRKDQLDENVPIDGMEKCLHYFQSIYPLHMTGERVDHTNHLSNVLKVRKHTYTFLRKKPKNG